MFSFRSPFDLSAQIAALESISIVITFYNETHLKKMLIQRLKQMFSSQQPDVNVSNRFCSLQPNRPFPPDPGRCSISRTVE